MKVYILDADVNTYRGIVLGPEEDGDEFDQRFDGTRMKATWKRDTPFVFVPRRMPKGDTPGLSSHIPVFNSKAVLALKDLLETSGELLPITCGGEDYFLFNVTRLVDALNEADCQLERFDDGRIIRIEHYSFWGEELIGEVVFKLHQDPLGWVYVTDSFVQRVKAAGLKGFDFPLVWSSD